MLLTPQFTGLLHDPIHLVSKAEGLNQVGLRGVFAAHRTAVLDPDQARPGVSDNHDRLVFDPAAVKKDQGGVLPCPQHLNKMVAVVAAEAEVSGLEVRL